MDPLDPSLLPYSATPCDKRPWLRGEWDREPDTVAWTHLPTRLSCALLRHPDFGHYCGYVGVPEEHPLWKVDTNDVVDAPPGAFDRTVNMTADVGVLTLFAAALSGDSFDREAKSIRLSMLLLCHGGVSYAGLGTKNPLWWIGFDAGHYGDFMPKRSLFVDPSGVYRPLAYMQAQANRLAEQITAYATLAKLPDGGGIKPLPTLV